LLKKNGFFSGDVIIPPRKLHFEADNWADGVPAHVLREAPTMGISGSFKRALLERGCFFAAGTSSLGWAMAIKRLSFWVPSNYSTVCYGCHRPFRSIMRIVPNKSS